jgi:hypothetical protein
MMERFTPWPKVSSRYGAPMGRFGGQIDRDVPLDRLAVAGPAGEYDAGGAYWGTGGEGPVWAVWVKGRGRDGVVYVRAVGRNAAKLAARGGLDAGAR